MLQTIVPCFVKFMPEIIEEGVLYISEEFQTAIHNCACGCGEKTVTPLNHMNWTLTKNDGKVSLSPSIGNFQIPCKSHYFITENIIRKC